jgi:hypothetical protein
VKNYSETKQSIWVFDGACGFNVTSYTHVSDDRVKIHDVIEYKKREDVFFPQSISLKHFQKRGDRVSLDFYRSFNLQDLEINSPIEESSFTLAAYPVPHGTRMLDEIRDELSVFDEKKNLFVPISNSE